MVPDHVHWIHIVGHLLLERSVVAADEVEDHDHHNRRVDRVAAVVDSHCTAGVEVQVPDEVVVRIRGHLFDRRSSRHGSRHASHCGSRHDNAEVAVSDDDSLGILVGYSRVVEEVVHDDRKGHNSRLVVVLHTVVCHLLDRVVDSLVSESGIGERVSGYQAVAVLC